MVPTPAQNYAGIISSCLQLCTSPNITCMCKVLVLNVYHSFEWTHHARSGSPLDDYQHLTSIEVSIIIITI